MYATQSSPSKHPPVFAVIASFLIELISNEVRAYHLYFVVHFVFTCSVQCIFHCSICSPTFSELIAYLANLFFHKGCFPLSFTQAIVIFVTPLLKKPALDSSFPSNYRPISSLNNISKILERLTRLQPHVTSSPNFNSLQSAYRRAHSTETALVNTLDYIHTSAGRSLPTILVSPDLSAAFDTIDHCTVLNRLENSFGITGLALSWIRSYLSNRSQCVAMGTSQLTLFL